GYRQEMHWWGSDQDGTVAGYEWRIVTVNDAGDATDSTAWTFTTQTDSTFDFPAPAAYARHLFEVRAVDNIGARDPVGASQELFLHNEPPTVLINRGMFPSESLPALTIFWSGRDPDGNGTIARYHAWIAGSPEDAAIVITAPDSSATLTPQMLAGPTGPR